LRRTFALIALAFLLASCGDGEETPPPDGLSHGAYVEQAEAICERADAAIAELKEPVQPADVAAYAQAAADIVDRERDELNALRPPAEDAAEAKALGAALAEVVKVARDLVEIARAGDAAAIRRYVERNATVDDEAVKIAAALGMKKCSSPPA
jgi:hypothetical protein